MVSSKTNISFARKFIFQIEPKKDLTLIISDQAGGQLKQLGKDMNEEKFPHSFYIHMFLQCNSTLEI